MTPVKDPALLAAINAAPSAMPSAVNDPVMLARLEHGIDIDQPDDAVRTAIGGLKGEAREKALALWAKHYVAKERQAGGVGMALDNTVRTLTRGTFAGPFLDELNAATASLSGTPYDEALAYQRARDAAVDQDYPALSLTGQVVGGLAGGGAALKAGSSAIGRTAGLAVGGPLATMRPAATAGNRIMQGAKVGAGYGAVGGFGNAEGGLDNRVAGAGLGMAAGTVLGGTFGGAVEGGRTVARAWRNVSDPTAGAYERVLANLGTMSVDDLADSVAVGATRNDQGVSRRALNVWGEEMVRARGDQATAAAAAIARIAREQGVTPQTARAQLGRIVKAHASNDLTFGEYPAVAVSNQATRKAKVVDDMVAGTPQPAGTQQLFDYISQSGNGRAAQEIRRIVEQRQPTLRDGMRQTLQTLAPGGRSFDDAEAVIEAAQKTAAQEYKIAFGAGENQARLVAGLEIAKRKALGSLGGRAGEHAAALRAALDEIAPITTRGPMPGGNFNARGTISTLQAVQDGRGAIRGMISQFQRAGRGDIVRVLKPFYDDVTRAMRFSSPAWGRANARWGDMSLQQDALEFGEALVDRAGPLMREAMVKFARMAPEAQDVMRIGYLQKLADKLTNLPDGHDVAKLFSTPAQRDVIKRLFGPEAAARFVRAVRDQKVATQTRRMLGGADTHRRGVAQTENDAEVNLVSSVRHANATGIRNWLTEILTTFLRERRNRRLGRIIATPMTNTAEVARHLDMLRQTQARLARQSKPVRSVLPVAGIVSGQAGRGLAPYERQKP